MNDFWIYKLCIGVNVASALLIVLAFMLMRVKSTREFEKADIE